MNRTVLIGNLTKDPELSQTNSGLSYCRFTLAIKRKFKSAQGETEVDFLNIITWRQLAENCNKFLKKGSKACVSGFIQTGSYEAKDGTRKYTFDIVADEVEFLTTPKEKVETKQEEVAELQPIDDDILPF